MSNRTRKVIAAGAFCAAALACSKSSSGPNPFAGTYSIQSAENGPLLTGSGFEKSEKLKNTPLSDQALIFAVVSDSGQVSLGGVAKDGSTKESAPIGSIDPSGRLNIDYSSNPFEEEHADDSLEAEYDDDSLFDANELMKAAVFITLKPVENDQFGVDFKFDKTAAANLIRSKVLADPETKAQIEAFGGMKEFEAELNDFVTAMESDMLDNATLSELKDLRVKKLSTEQHKKMIEDFQKIQPKADKSAESSDDSAA